MSVNKTTQPTTDNDDRESRRLRLSNIITLFAICFWGSFKMLKLKPTPWPARPFHSISFRFGSVRFLFLFARLWDFRFLDFSQRHSDQPRTWEINCASLLFLQLLLDYKGNPGIRQPSSGQTIAHRRELHHHRVYALWQQLLNFHYIP